MPERMARYANPDLPAEPTEVAVLGNPVITNATVLDSSALPPAVPVEPSPVPAEQPAPAPVEQPVPVPIEPQPPTPEFEAPSPVTGPLEPLPEPASLSELTSPASLVRDANFASTISIDTANRLQSQFYPSNNQLPAQFAVDRFKVRFKSRNELGHWVSVRAEIFVPKVNEPTEFPLFVYGAGTTGIANQCAPLDEDSRGRNWGQYQTHLLSYAAQGFITVLPHWQGYDDHTRKHNYFIAGLEASIMLDATRAVYELFNQNALNVQARPAQAVFYGGYSQGAHGAFAALDSARHYAPDIPIKGIVGHATAPSVEALMRERPPLAPYIVYSYLNYYGGDVIEPELVFLSNWIPTFYNDASTKCVDEAYSYYPEDPRLLYRPEFIEILYGDRLGEIFPAFKQALEMNYVGDSPDTNVPVVLFHGAADSIVTPQTYERFIARLCNIGANVSYKLYPEINHFQTRQVSFADSVNWMRNIMNGQAPESQCSEFFNSQFE
jgi:predicted esterase